MSKDTDSRIQPVRQTTAALIGNHAYAGLLSVVFACFALVSLAACRSSASEGTSNTGQRSIVQKITGTPRHYALGLRGYNYTDRYMDDLSVIGESAGNVAPSGPGGGGGRGVCCIGWTDGTPLPQTMEVEWLVGTCLATVTNSDGEKSQTLHHRTEKATGVLQGPIPKNPGYFEIHVYPNKHVELAITESSSEPRLKLDPDRDHNDYPDCPAS